MKDNWQSTNVCDKTGNLLFYMDIHKAYDKYFQVMQGNNNYFGVSGYWVGIREYFIIKSSIYTNRYFIYYMVNYVNNTPRNDLAPGLTTKTTLNRMIIDMDSNNGAGKIIKNEMNLMTFTPRLDGISACIQSNQKDYWLLCTFNSTLSSYSISGDSIIKNSVHYLTLNKYNLYQTFITDISLNSKLIVLAMVRGSLYDSNIVLLKFNNNNGTFSSPIYFDTGVPPIIPLSFFSPDSRILYFTFYDSYRRTLGQFSLSNFNRDSIVKSKFIIFYDSTLLYNLVSPLGPYIMPDNKIYFDFMKSNYVSVIDNPNGLGNKCNFKSTDIRRSLAFAGLNSFIPQKPWYSGFYVSNACLGTSAKFTFALDTTNKKYYWNFGDIKSGIFNTSTDRDPTHEFIYPGRYKIQLVTEDSGRFDSMYGYVCIYDSIHHITDTSLCQNTSIVLDAGIYNAKYLWSTSDTTKTLSINAPGTYQLEIKTRECTYRDTFTVFPPLVNYLFYNNDTVLCRGQLLKPETTYPIKYPFWSTGETAKAIVPDSSGKYSLKAEAAYCLLTDTINVILDTLPDKFLPADTGFCQGTNLFLDYNLGQLIYLWNTGAHSSSITVDTGGFYWLKINNSRCTQKDTILVKVLSIPAIALDSKIYNCFNKIGNIVIDAGNFKSYLWEPFSSTERTLSISAPGTYSVEVTDSNNCLNSDTVIVFDYCEDRAFIPNAFTPNKDGRNDYFCVSFPENINSFNIKIFSRWGEKIFESDDINNCWDGNYKNTSCQSGVYCYTVTIVDQLNNKKKYKGNLTLIR